MAAKKRSSRKGKLLSSSRPPTSKRSPFLSSRATRNLIRTHHILGKQLSNAQAANDTELAASLQAKIDAQGGIKNYQRASITGQSSERGGDSSKVLMEWLSPLFKDKSMGKQVNSPNTLKMLEVGALRVDNACSRSGLFIVDRIDLNSQHAEILEQDFMERPIPGASERDVDGFDVVSLSLVLNYVGDPKARGDMLGRVGMFMRSKATSTQLDSFETPTSLDEILPALFLVLPKPCVENSRYLNEEGLRDMMVSVGYELVQCKASKKLVYYLWSYKGPNEVRRKVFRKAEMRAGGTRNNFAIVMR